VRYGRGESISGDGGGGGSDVYKGRAEPVLVSLSDSYSDDDNISVYDSRPSSVLPTQLLTTSSTGYCPKKKKYAMLS